MTKLFGGNTSIWELLAVLGVVVVVFMLLRPSRRDVLRRITQSVSWILTITIVIGTPLVLGLLYRFSGLTGWVDGFWPAYVPFWLLWVLSRVVFGAAWTIGDFYGIEGLVRHGWLWFKPERNYSSRDEGENRDLSGTIAMIVVLSVFAFMVCEMAIRITSGTYPPFLPPPQ